MEFTSDTSLVQVTVDEHGVALIKLNRPEKRNALSQKFIDSICSTFAMVERDGKVKVVVLTGSQPAGPFSAGADLSEMLHLTTSSAHQTSYLKDLSDAITSMRKPIICAVAGFALGGGFELALMCDIIYSTVTAKFGLPELSVGTIPGAGGTQRLTRVIGKWKAMDLILSSDSVTGKELEGWGLVARCFENEDGKGLLEGTLERARKIAVLSGPVARLAKESILNAELTDLNAGLKLERELYYASFSLEDRTEGMKAFVEKRKPVFMDR